jgi:RNA polymerase sigma-70 factor, ECF subfamily
MPVSAAEPEVPDLATLMLAYQRGDVRAVDLLVAQLAPQLYRFFSAQEATRNEAEDMVQETCLRVHHVRHTYRHGEPVLAWVYGIARHVRVDAFRKRQRRGRFEVAVEVLPERAQEPMPAEDTSLAACLKKLPDSQREVVIMMKVEGMSLEEVARATSMSVGAVKQKAHRAYCALRECLGTRVRP